MSSQCSYEKMLYGERRHCQFDVPTEDLIDFGGKKWCLFHLPVERETDKSEKALQGASEDEWNRYQDAFNSKIFRYVALRLKQIDELIKSDSKEGSYEIDLSGVVFPCYIDFCKCPEIEHGIVSLNLSDAVFNSDVDFIGLKFFSPTSFINTKFNRQVLFNGASFWQVSFRHAFFHGLADFENVVIKNIGDFRNTIFNGEALFDKLQCKEGAQISFEDAEFRYGCFFREAQFLGKVNYRNGLFGGGAYFTNAVFKGDANFEQTVDTKKTIPDRSRPREFIESIWFIYLDEDNPGKWMMDETKFQGRAIFRRRQFLIPTNFNAAEFDKVPEFQDAEFNKDTQFKGTIFRDFIGHDNADAVGAYRALQQVTKQVVSKEEEINFAALRQNALIKSRNTSLFYKAILLGFKFACDFGRNIAKVILLLLLTNLVFFVIYEAISWSGWHSIGKCFTFTVNQIKSPYALWVYSYIEKVPDYITANITVFQILTSIHATINGLLSLALLWSIQIRFRIF